MPVAVCDVRRGVGLELPALADAHVHCVVRGHGLLRVAHTGNASALRGGASGGNAPALRGGASTDVELQLSPATLAIVPAHTAHAVEPSGGCARMLTVGSATSSDHVPTVTAGGGEPGLTLVSGRICASVRHAFDLFDGMTAPVAVGLSDVARVHPLFEALLDEQSGRAPGNRRVTALLMQQFLMYVLRKLYADRNCPLPWLAAIREPGLARALDAMLRSPSGPHSVKSLAATAGMTRPGFSACFARAFGLAPLDWLKLLRVQAPRTAAHRVVAARASRTPMSARRTRPRPEA